VFKHWQQLKGKLHPLARRLESDPTYRLRSYQEVHLAAELGFTIDVNRATVDDWLRLPGVSIRQAQTLTQLRGMGMQFYSVDDLAAALGVSSAQLQPLGGILSFCHYDDCSAIAPRALSLNHASSEQLSKIPGVTHHLAAKIVHERTSRGPFHNLADLQKRLGLSAEQIQALMYYLRA
jgi:DNA uptake protein ComE-like DNA-binding protein